MKNRQTDSEAAETRHLVAWLRFRCVRFFAIPNGTMLGGYNRYAVMAQLKAQGLHAGAPDLVLIDRSPKTGRPVAVEMKRRIGGRLSEAQKLTHAIMRGCDWDVVVGWGFESARNQITELGF